MSGPETERPAQEAPAPGAPPRRKRTGVWRSKCRALSVEAWGRFVEGCICWQALQRQNQARLLAKGRQMP
eukprot:7808111-Lingulodinium_polyedra.AAC.1